MISRILNRRLATLLVVTRSEVARADFSIGNTVRLINRDRVARPESQSLTAGVELALSLNGGATPRAVLLTDECWTGIIDVDVRAVEGLEAPELKQMLNFESESFSGLDPMASHLGFLELARTQSESRRFWTTAISSAELNTAAEAVSLRGGKLTQIAHPLGATIPPSRDPISGTSAWIEFTPDLAGVFSATGDSQSVSTASIVSRTSSSNRWWSSLANALDGNLPRQGWKSVGADPVPKDYTGDLYSLSEEAAWEQWLVGIGGRLTSATDSTPVVEVPAPEASAGARTRVGAVAAVAVAGLCGLHYASGSWNMASIRQQIAALEEPAEEKRKIDAERQTVEKEIGELEKTVQVIENQQAGLAQLTAHSDRFAELLRLIAAGRDENLVVDEISVHEEGLRLAGRAIRSDAATGLALHLSPRAAEIGWKVKAPTLEGENRLASGGPWQFTIDLVDAPPTPNEYDTGRTGTMASVRKPTG